MEKFGKVASLGALAVAGGTFALYAALLFAFRPVAGGGMSALSFQIVAIAMLVPVGVLAGAHVAFARQLSRGAQPIR